MSLFDVEESEPVAENWNPFGEEFEAPDGPGDGTRRPSFNKYNGRYDDLPPVPGFENVKSWTRVTTLKSTLEDQSLLEAWKRRQVVIGIKAEPKLLGEFGPQLDPSTRFGKNKINAIADRAIEIAGAHTGRERGTDLHTVIEDDQFDRLDLDALDDETRTWFEGYRRCLDDHKIKLLPEYSERTVVIPEIGCAGTLDTIALDNGLYRIGDLKSQKTLIFGQMSVCIQLACYSRAAFMLDQESWTWQNMPQVEQDKGVIIWAPAIEPGRAEVHDVDLDFGWEMALESVKARKNRNRKGIITKRG